MFNICTSLQKIKWGSKTKMFYIAWAFAVSPPQYFFPVEGYLTP